MGGTLGAILSIFFNAFASEIALTQSLTKAPARACKNLESYTPARVGHRTIMDVIIPATMALEEKGTMEAAFKAAQTGAESTKYLRPLLGRSTYVGCTEGNELPPDAGAWGAMQLIKGLYEGLSELRNELV
jgi:triose/dihydroxyacetone kinase / FAD-AMP lyase (cyclizing)